MTTRVGIFELVNPPSADHVEVFAHTIDSFDFPWRWILPELVRAGDRSVQVHWRDQRQGVTGTYWSRSNHIEIRPSITHDNTSFQFTVAHEIGHCIDDAVLTKATKRKLIDLFHEGDFVKLGHYDHDHPDAGHGSESWSSSANAYPSRINECFADQFVAAFAPAIWNGETPYARQHYPRFVHWTEDHEAVRSIVLSQEPKMFTDIDGNVHKDNIEDVAAVGIITGKSDGTFDPNENLTRAQAATLVARTLDEVKPGWRPTGE